MINRFGPSPEIPGKTSQAFPTQDITDLLVNEEIACHPENYTPLPPETPHPDNARTRLNLILVGQGPSPIQTDPPQVRRVYMTLPGAWTTDTRIDPDGVIVTIKTRKALSRLIVSGETVIVGIWTKTVNGAGGDAVLGDEIQETRPVPGNPIPSQKVDPDGAVVSITKTLKASSTIVSVETLIGGIWSETLKEPVSQLVAYEVVKSRVVPGGPMIISRQEPDGAIATITRTLKDRTTITNGETLNSLIWTRTTQEDPPVFRGFELRSGNLVAWEIVETRAIPGNPITKTDITKDGDVMTETRTLSQASTIATTTSIVAGVWTRTFEELITGSFLVAWKVVQVRNTANAQPFYAIEIPDLVPPKMRELVPDKTTDTIVIGTASPPSLLTGDLFRSQQQLDQYTYRLKIINRDLSGLPVILTGKRVLGDGRQATVTEELALGAQTVTVTARTIEGDVEPNLPGTTLKTQVEADEALPQTGTTNKQTIEPPRKFLTLTSDQTVEQIIESTAVTPDALGSDGLGVVESTAKQIAKYRGSKQTRTRAGSLATNPVTEYRKNAKGQLVTRSDSYGTDGTAPTINALTEDARVEALGDGKFVRTIDTIPAVFPGQVYAATIPDSWPVEFRTALPDTTSDVIAAGTTVSPPTLGADEVLRSVSQVDANTIRTRVNQHTHLVGSLELDDHKLDGIRAGNSLFNSDVTKSRVLSGSIPSIDQTFLVIESSTKNLGDGKFIKEDWTIDGFPQLVEQIADPQFGARLNKVKTVVGAGTALPPGLYGETLAIDKKRTLQIIENIDISGSIAYVFPGTTNIDLPPELQSITGFMASSGGAGSFSESGSYTFAGQGSGGVNVRGSAKGSAAVIPEISYELKQAWGSNVPCIHVLFFTTNNPTRGQLIALMNTVSGLNAIDWPKFVPQEVTLILTGRKSAITIDITQSAHDSIATDYTGAITHSGSIRTQGFGNSFDAGVSQKVVRIPATIHPALTVGGQTTNTAAFSAGGAINIGNGIWQPAQLNGSAQGQITPTSIPATNGQQTIPLGGNYVYRLLTEPYKQGTIKVHAEVVSFELIN